MRVVRNLVTIAAFVLASCMGGAVYADGAVWPVKDDDGCLVLGANLQFAVQAVVEGKRTLQDVVAFHNGKIDECFASEANCIFINKDDGKAFVDAAIPRLVAAVKAGKMTVNDVAVVVVMQCRPASRGTLPDGIKPTGPQISS